jgi:hypothetical protein
MEGLASECRIKRHNAMRMMITNPDVVFRGHLILQGAARTCEGTIVRHSDGRQSQGLICARKNLDITNTLK